MHIIAEEYKDNYVTIKMTMVTRGKFRSASHVYLWTGNAATIAQCGILLCNVDNELN